MIFALSYRPVPSSYPDAQHIGGDTDRMELEDPTPDGGIGITTQRYHSGRRLRTDNAPSHVRWLSRRRLLDFESTRMSNVGERMRALIEDIEPGTHQFIPVEFIDREGRHLEHRWFWQVCRRLDSVHRERTNWILKHGVVWSAARVQDPRLVFDRAKVGAAQFWHDKHFDAGPFLSHSAKERFDQEEITGVEYHAYEEA